MTDHIPHNDSTARPLGTSSRLAERVLGRITTEHVTPRARWSFAAENWLFWLLGTLAVALGSLASAAALFELANAGWAFYAATHRDLFTFTLAAAPFLWLLVLALFILLGYENIRRTKRGYRYPFALIVLGAVLTSIMLGAALFAAGFGEEVDEAVGDHPPFYRPAVIMQHSWWLQPARGLLGGQVVGVSSSSDTFFLKAFDGTVWTVDASDLSTSSATVVARGGIVRVEGVPDASATSTLHACEVFFWQTYGAATAPPPGIPFSPPSERSSPAARNEMCKGASPYGPPQGVTSGE